MLKVFHDTGTGLTFDTFTEYGSSGQVILTAAPSAVTGYSTTYASLLDYVSGSYADLSSSSGLITTYNYYTSTTATSTTAGGRGGLPGK
ncbi:MAG TPA: hypothetical protein VG122_24370 [Gemmata sp.]|jgi:hypothetical protein|nr:hypothetical protein [Gemmata sp.]